METKEIKLSEFLDKVASNKSISMDLSHDMLIGSFVSLMLTNDEELVNISVTLLLSSYNQTVLNRHRKHAKHPLVGYKLIGDILTTQQLVMAINLSVSGFGLVCPHCIYEKIQEFGEESVRLAFVEWYQTEYEMDVTEMSHRLIGQFKEYAKNHPHNNDTSVN